MAKVDFGYRDVSAHVKSDLVSSVFASVAPRYDIMNDVMSLGAHRHWKRVLLSMAVIAKERVLLDVAGGSGDIARLFLRRGGASAVICDISEEMLTAARRRSYDGGISGGGFGNLDYVVGDAEALPFAERFADIYTIGFGLRNVTRRERALAEAYRVLRPGGQFLCLEFCPQVLSVLAPLYDFYSHRVIPRLGRLIAGDSESYRYLVESIRRFPNPERLSMMMRSVGFSGVRYRLLSGGIVAIHSAYKTAL